MNYLVFVLGVLLQTPSTYARSSGAPGSSCVDLTPRHGPAPQTLPSPYVVLLSKTSYKPGDKIEVTLQARCEQTFKGFLLQARRADPQTDTTEYIGSFTPVTATAPICDNSDGILRGLTHSNSADRSVVKVTWNAPIPSKGNIIFKATFVREFQTYWVGINSAVLHDPGSPPLSINETSLVSSTMAPCTLSAQASSPGTSLASSPGTSLTSSPGSSLGSSPGSSIASSPGLSLASSPGLSAPSSPGSSSASSPGLSLASSSGLSIAASPGLSIATSPGLSIASSPGLSIASSAASLPGSSATSSSGSPSALSPGLSLRSSPGLSLASSAASLSGSSASSSSGSSLSSSPESSAASSQTPSHTSLSRDKQCRVTLGCFDDCTDTGCTFTVTWMEEGSNIHFWLKSISYGNTWMAVGFSDDLYMGSDSVVECIMYGGVVKVFQSYNDGYSNTRLVHPDVGISKPSGSDINGVFECNFLRQTIVAGNAKIFNLTNDYHVMFAHGTSLPGFWTMPHKPKDQMITASVVDFQTIDYLESTTAAGMTLSSWSIKTSTLQPSTKGLIRSSQCGTSEGCFDDCNKGCTFTVIWAEEGDKIRFRLKSYSSGNSWMAVGFSSDQKMGDDAVVECVIYDGVVKAFQSHNTGYSNSRLSHSEKGLSDVKGSVNNGVFDCSFLREIGDSENTDIFNLTQKWYLMYAHGPARKNFVKLPHRELPSVTSSQVDFRKFASAASSKPTFLLVQVHGSLMCIAWLFCASIGLLLARYFKPMWPDTTLGGVKVWFQIHRSCMGLTFLLTIAAFVIIFIEAQGYSQITGADYKKAHPILGIIVTALVVINPVMAYFRPGPKADRRPLFNWAHFLVGIGAYVLAVVTIFFGMELSKAGVPFYMKYILAGYVAWQLIVEVCLETLECLSKRRESQPFDDIQMQNPSSQGKPEKAPVSLKPRYASTKQLLLGLHVCVVFGVTLTAIAILVVPDIA